MTVKPVQVQNSFLRLAQVANAKERVTGTETPAPPDTPAAPPEGEVRRVPAASALPVVEDVPPAPPAPSKSASSPGRDERGDEGDVAARPRAPRRLAPSPRRTSRLFRGFYLDGPQVKWLYSEQQRRRLEGRPPDDCDLSAIVREALYAFSKR